VGARNEGLKVCRQRKEDERLEVVDHPPHILSNDYDASAFCRCNARPKGEFPRARRGSGVIPPTVHARLCLLEATQQYLFDFRMMHFPTRP
jgi:hypothetical protein